MGALRAEIEARPVFAVDDETFSWADVVAAARGWGWWSELEEHVRQGLACRRRLAAAGEELDARELVDATNAFRYGRSLLAGEQLEEWLEHWGLTAAELRDYIRRMLLRERWSGELGETAQRFPVSDEDITRAVWPEAVCSGFLERIATRVAGDCALAVAAGETIRGDRKRVLAGVESAAARARADAISADAIAREVASHTLEWLRLEGGVLEFGTEDVAREAALCIRSDGQSLTEVAAASGVQPGTLSVFAADVEPELSSLLVAASEGELVGPVAREDGFSLVLLERKRPPQETDPEVRTRAEERIVDHAVDRAFRDHVEWHERF